MLSESEKLKVFLRNWKRKWLDRNIPRYFSIFKQVIGVFFFYLIVLHKLTYVSIGFKMG